MSDVIESPWVGVIMDIAQTRADWETAKEPEDRWYGDGFSDDLQDARKDARLGMLLQISEAQWLARPESWARLLTWLVNDTLFTTDLPMVRTKLLEIGAVVTAWVEDLDRRIPTK